MSPSRSKSAAVSPNDIMPALLKSGHDSHRDVDVRDDLHELAKATVRPAAGHAA